MWKAPEIVVSVLALFFGVVCLISGLLFLFERRGAASRPQTLSFQQLTSHGYGDNSHVLLTDFGFGRNYVRREHQGVWERVWIPLLPPGIDRSNSLQVMLASDLVKDRFAASQLFSQQQVQGIVTKFISLTEDERKLLMKEFPHTQFEKCYILRHVALGSTLPHPATAFCCIMPGAILLFGGLARIVMLLTATSQTS